MFNLSAGFRRLAVLVFLLATGLAAEAQTTRLRLMAANTSSGNQQSYIEHGNRIFQGLDPDIVMIQEFNIGSSASQDAGVTNTWVNDNFGPGFSWFREGGNEQIPNGIISRYPILQSGDWVDSNVSNRDFAWARIDIPGDKDLWAISVHFLTTGSSNRNSQATLLRSYIQANVPAGDYIAIGGDFNTDSRSEACISTLSSVVTTASPHPVDKNNNGNTNAGRNKPYDWMLVSSGMQALKTSVVIGSNTFANGLVFDSRVYTPLSEVAPVQSGDSGASNMQHMAVVKDYLIPDSGGGPGDDFSVAPTSVNFGTVDATAGPFNNSSVTITVTTPFQLNSVSFTGTHAGEFSLVSPNLSGGAAAISTNTPLTLRWTPAANDGATHSATAQFATSGTPAGFSIALSGTPNDPPGGGGASIDASGYIVQQTNSTQQITLPAGTVVDANKCIVIGRDATKAAFESVWGALPAGTIYINAGAVPTVFPAINGGEQFRLLDGSLTPLDPTSGYHPASGITTALSYTRTATNGATFTSAALATGTPGSYSGTKAGTNKLVITEFSDATAFANEFVELYNDAAPVATPPAAPTGLTATPGDASVVLDWNDSAAAGLQGYSVYRGTVSGGPYTKLNGALIPASNYTDATAVNGTLYYYVVTATANALESVNSAQVFATPQVPVPNAPTGLQATAGDAQVALEWADSLEAGMQGYTVFRATESEGEYTALNGSLLGTSTYLDTTALNGTTYFYVVTVTVSGQQSEYSVEVSATPQATPTPPAAPTGLTAAAGLEQVVLDWADSPDSNLQGYTVYRATVNGGTYTAISGALLTESNFVDAGAAIGTLYYYVVTATGNGLESAESAQASAAAYGPAAPTPPTGLTAEGGIGEIALNWDDSATTGVQGFHVYRGTQAGGPYVRLTGALLTASAYEDTPTTNGVNYYYVVTETSGGVESGNSAEVFALSRPASPTGLFTMAFDARVELTWDAVTEPGVEGYYVYRGTEPYGPFDRISTSLVATPEYVDTDVVNETRYTYCVTVVVSGVESYLSHSLPATPSGQTAAAESWALYP